MRKLADSNLKTYKPIYLGDDEKFEAQRKRLEDFFFDFYQGLRKSLNEIEGDLSVLKELKADIGTIKMLGRVFHQVNDLAKKATPERPYLAVEELNKWLNDKNNKSIIDNLNFIIDAIISKQKPKNDKNFIPTAILGIKGLKNLVKEIEKAKIYMDKNPMLPDPREMPTVTPPKLINEQTSISSKPAKNDKAETLPDPYKLLDSLKEFN